MKIKIKQLTPTFWRNNPNLIESMTAKHDKGRGYGVTIIELNNLLFAIPLRTNCNPKTALILDKKRRDGKLCFRGFDFRKAVLIKDSLSELGDNFKIPSGQMNSLNKIKRDNRLQKDFSRYVERYVYAAKNDDNKTLNDNPYRYSTLVNYHHELDIYSSK